MPEGRSWGAKIVAVSGLVTLVGFGLCSKGVVQGGPRGEHLSDVGATMFWIGLGGMVLVGLKKLVEKFMGGAK